MHMIPTVCFVLMMVAMGASSSAAQTPSQKPMAAGESQSLAGGDKTFLTHAAQSGEAEIELGKMAQDKAADGKVFYGDQRMSRMEALRSYTVANAYAAFEEDIKGSLTRGKLADVTVLTKDITAIPDDQIKTAKVAYTIIGGKVVYKAN